jgi:predicted PurR-regulated permease PerM
MYFFMNSDRIQIVFFGILLFGALALSYAILSPYLSPLFLSLVLYIVWKPVHHRVSRVFGKHESLSALVSLLCVIVTILLPFIFFGTLLSEDARNLYNDISQSGSSATSVEKLSDLLHGKGADFLSKLGVDIAGYATAGLNALVKNANVVFSGTVRIVFGFFVMLIALFYLFRDGGKLRATVFRLSPLANTYDADIFNKIEHAVGSVVKGSLLIALAQGVMAIVGMLLFGVPNAVLWGSLAAVVAIIPNIGTSLVLIPAVIYLYLGGHIGAAVGLAIWSAIIVGLIDNVLRMFVIKTGVHIHPFIIFLSVVGGISFFGPVGLIAGPIVVSLVYALFDIYPSVMKGTLSS